MADIRKLFSEVINRVTYGSERIIVHRRNKDLAAIVPLKDLALIEYIEDKIDREEIEKVLADLEVEGAISLENLEIVKSSL